MERSSRSAGRRMNFDTDFFALLTSGLGFLTAWWLITFLPPKFSRVLMPVLIVTVAIFAYQFIPWNQWWYLLRSFAPN